MPNKYGAKCPKCGSTAVWKCGFVPIVAGRKDKFRCTECGHSFTGEPKPYPKKVTEKPKRVRKPRAKKTG